MSIQLTFKTRAIAMLLELSKTWSRMAEMEDSSTEARRATFRECADGLNNVAEFLSRCPESSNTEIKAFTDFMSAKSTPPTVTFQVVPPPVEAALNAVSDLEKTLDVGATFYDPVKPHPEYVERDAEIARDHELDGLYGQPTPMEDVRSPAEEVQPTGEPAAAERSRCIATIRRVQAAYDAKLGPGPSVEASMCSDCIGAIQAAPPAATRVPLSCTPAMHAAVRKVMKHHGLTEVGDGVIEADLIAAVIEAASQEGGAA